MAITLTVEDGTGLADANTYIALADADAYFANRINDTWLNGTDDQRSSALIQATQYLDSRYTFKGVPLTDTQALQWPRQAPPYQTTVGFITEVYAGDSTLTAQLAWPVQRVKDATCEAALRALSGGLYTDEDSRIVTSEKVDVVAVTYAEHSRNGGQVRIAIIDDLLKPVLASNGYNLQVVRA